MDDLKETLSNHELWLKNEGGERANLSGADLRRANLSEADLSGATGLQTAREFMSTFDKDACGWIVYKSFGDHYYLPNTWEIKPGVIIEEVVNQLPSLGCACGINFATLDWCTKGAQSDIWKCRIRFEDGPDITVPYNTDGKARCGRLELIEIVEKR